MDSISKTKLEFCTKDECLDRCGVNSEITRLCDLLPDEYNYTVCQFDIIDEGIFALLRMDIKTEYDARTWLRLFQEKTHTALRLLWTGTASGQKNIFSAHYRCQHGSFRKSHLASSSSKTKITNCPARLAITVKRVFKRNRSLDIHVRDLPTLIRLSFTHNHPVMCAKPPNSRNVSGEVTVTNSKPLESGHSPSVALHAHKYDLSTMSASRTNQGGSGHCCVVLSCHNSWKKLNNWKTAECEIHSPLSHQYCACLKPYSLHRFPGRKKCEGIRLQWIKNINRKDFKLSDHSVVCGIHFLEGRPTKVHPYPVLHMGYDSQHISPHRAPPKRRSNQPETEASTAKILFKGLRKSDASESPIYMAGAIDECKNGEIRIHTLSQTFKVPKFTLTRKMKVTVGEVSEADMKTKLHVGWKSMFGDENEAELVRLILNMEARGFRLSRHAVRKLGYQFAESKNIEHIFDKETGLASQNWIDGFLNRHPDIVPRTAEWLSKTRASSLQQVTRFFDRLCEIMDREHFRESPEKIYNVDECSLAMMNHSGSMSVLKGMGMDISETISEKANNFTVVVGCCSATGQYIPPFIILNGKKREEFSDGLLEVSYINEGSFLQWLQLFRKHAVEGNVLLIIDGLRRSYAKSARVQQYCIDHNIILFCLPVHSKDYLQPLSQCVFSSLKDNWQTVRDLFLLKVPGATITEHSFGALFAGAWRRTASVASATFGFRACGIHPFNPGAIPIEVFTSAWNNERQLKKVLVRVKEEPRFIADITEPDSPVVQDGPDHEYAAVDVYEAVETKYTVKTEAPVPHMSSTPVVPKGVVREPMNSCGCCDGFSCNECDEGWIAC